MHTTELVYTPAAMLRWGHALLWYVRSSITAVVGSAAQEDAAAAAAAQQDHQVQVHVGVQTMGDYERERESPCKRRRLQEGGTLE